MATNIFNNPNPYQQSNQSMQPAQTAAASNVAPKSFWGGVSSWLGNTANNALGAVNNFGSQLGMGVNTLFPGSVPKWNTATGNTAPTTLATTKPPVPTTTVKPPSNTNVPPPPPPVAPPPPPPPPIPKVNADIPETSNTTAQGNAIQNMTQPTLVQQVAQKLADIRGNNPDVQNAYNTVTNLESGLQAGGNVIQQKPIPLEFQQGQMAALQRDYGPQLTAAKDILQSTITGQGQQLQGLQAAGGLASPIQVPYSNQVVSPLTGEPIQIGQGNTGLAGQIPNLAKSVLNGSVSYDQAVSQLGGIPTLSNQLLQEIQKTNPNFNVAQSNANQAAQGQALTQNITQGRALNLAANSANAALDKLQTDFGNLPFGEKSGLPFMIGMEQWMGKQFGEQALATYQTTLSDARAQLAGVLTSSGAVSPTGAEDMAKTYLPDNMTPSQLASKITAARALVAQKVQAFTQTGNIPQYGTGAQTGGGLYNF